MCAGDPEFNNIILFQYDIRIIRASMAMKEITNLAGIKIKNYKFVIFNI
jgi:hypothetical protein